LFQILCDGRLGVREEREQRTEDDKQPREMHGHQQAAGNSPRGETRKRIRGYPRLNQGDDWEWILQVDNRVTAGLRFTHDGSYFYIKRARNGITGIASFFQGNPNGFSLQDNFVPLAG
jgi:hypothetical protein